MSAGEAKLTLADIEAKVKSEVYFRESRMTLCVLTAENGFMAVGQSSCVRDEDFRADLGVKYAREDAIDKLWAAEGYAQRERIFKASN